MPEGKILFEIKYQQPLESVAALFSNFLGVSRTGTEVQFEFVFLDINRLAQLTDEVRQSLKGNGAETETKVDIEGKTVAKIVMPLHAFLQVKAHIEGLYRAIEADLAKAAGMGSSTPSVSAG